MELFRLVVLGGKVRARLGLIGATAVTLVVVGQLCFDAASADVLPASPMAAPTSTPNAAPAAQLGATPPASDPFYRYDGATPLARMAPGTVLKTRTTTVHLATLPLPVTAVQLLYRTADQLGDPVATVATVLQPPTPNGPAKLLSYQSFYDSLTPNCEPSYVLAGGFDHGGVVTSETPVMAGFLLQGYTVVTSDFESQRPTFADGPQYAMETLDGIRAALNSRVDGLREDTKVGMIGYSGGAIATEWATELAPRYAPEINHRLVGSAIGGVMVDPIHNLHYVDGSQAWSGVMPMALIGIARAYNVDLTPYLSAYGQQLYSNLQGACIFDALGHYPGLTFAKLVKPQYARPESIPIFVRIVDQLIMGNAGTPSVPMFIRQATAGQLEGTAGDKPGIGAGDGVMIAGDVRSLAREYCARGVQIDYGQYPALSHIPGGATFIADATPWLAQRFSGAPSPSNCNAITPGNPINPIG